MSTGVSREQAVPAPDSPASTAAWTPGEVRLACRLRHRDRRRGPSPIAGEIELENASPTPLDIEVHSSPLQYLELVVTDATGAVVSDSPYGDLFSPLAAPHCLRLGPGEKFVAPVSLLGNVDATQWRPGEYQVVAVYEYRGVRAVSEPLGVHLAEGHGL